MSAWQPAKAIWTIAMRRWLVILLAPLVVATGISAAPAQSRWIDEGKVGLLAHDINLGEIHEEPGVDINGEVLFASPNFLKVIGAPRPHLGGSVNTAGATSNGYFGLTWKADLLDVVFGALGLGGAIHDGQINGEVPNRKQLGSRILFHEYVELGHSLTPLVSLSIFVDHMSNANLARHNGGITDAGLRAGFKF
jgi:lipid A 3-O-deacylase